jgi:hypothetical protein
MNKEDSYTRMTMAVDPDIAKVMNTESEKRNVSRTKLVEALFLGLSEDQMNAAATKGLKILEERRTNYLKNRKTLGKHLSTMSPEQVNELVSKLDAKS